MAALFSKWFGRDERHRSRSPGAKYHFDPSLDQSIHHHGNEEPPPYEKESKISKHSSETLTMTVTPPKPTANVDYLRKPLRQESIENALEQLRDYDTIFVVDDSLSMDEFGKWQEARQVIGEVTELCCKYDDDGIEVHFINSPKVGENLKKAREVKQLFDSVEPSGQTPLGDKLDILLRRYLGKLERAKKEYGDSYPRYIKRVNYIVITDGRPTDMPEVPIVSAADRLTRGDFPFAQLGIQMVQIGNDMRAQKYLQKLDDDLVRRGCTRDIVDTTPYTEGYLSRDMLIKILLGGINRREDEKGNAASRS